MDDHDFANLPAFVSGKPPRPPKKFRVLNGGADDEGAPGRVPPHSVEAEEQLLSAILLDGGDVMARCQREKIVPGAFYVPANRVLFERLAAMHAAGLCLDMAVLAEELKLTGQLEEIGGYAYLTRVSGRIPTTAGASYFIDKVKELWLLREAIRRATELVEGCYGYTGPSVESEIGPYVLKLQRLVDFASKRSSGPAGLLLRIRERMKRTLAMVAGEVDSSRWLTFGDPYIDGIFLPMDTEEEDWLIYFGGPPSGGKSARMRQVTMTNVRRGKCAAVFLLETGLRWLEQAAASEARVNLRQRHEWTRDMVLRYQAAMAEIEGFVADGRLHVFDDIFFVEDIERATREINRGLRERQISAGVPEGKARGLDFIVGDYLQLMGTRADRGGRMTREQVVSTVSRTLKLMLKQLNIVGLIGAQVNRAGRDDPEKVPTLRDLRESGSIEQDADRVIFVHTPPNNKAGMAQTGDNPVDEIELHQRKSRNGPRDVAVGELFEKKFTRYYPREDRPSAAPGLPKPAGGYNRGRQS